MRRSLIAVSLSVLVLLSGCSLLGGGGTPSPTDAEPSITPTPTPTSEATPTPTPTATATPSVEYPEGYNRTGVEDAIDASLSHTNSLVDHSSFIVTVNGTVLTTNRTARIHQLQSVDIERNRALATVNDTDGVVRATYFDGEQRYRRVDPPGANDTRYNVTNATFSPRTFTANAFVTPVLRNVTYGEANVTETANGTFFTYRAERVDRSALGLLLGPSVDPENVTGFDASVVVDEEGIVRRMGYRAVVDRGDEQLVVSIDLRTYAIDEVDISPPPWLDEARQADSS